MAWLLACVAGCGERVVEFQRDELLHASAELSQPQSSSVDAALMTLFGTPDEPRLPAEMPVIAELLDEERLRQAAGAVISHEPGVTQGLYRRHCARCHGVTGDGRGPVARHLSPLPRDFRRGLFKWKSTCAAGPPTDDDLHGVLERGVPGTSMPSFALLSDDERATLVEYLKYLAIRGQTERALVAFVAEELPIDASLDLRGDQWAAFRDEWLEPIAESWRSAGKNAVAAPAAAPGIESVTAGRELYHSERAGCVKCHGAEGRGGAIAGVDYPIDYDRWTRDRVEAASLKGVRSLLHDDLPVRPTVPRQLAGAMPHGGDSFATLYQSIHQGIAGTTMPAVGATGPHGTGSLTDEEVAKLAAYVATLMNIAEPEPAGIAAR